MRTKKTVIVFAILLLILFGCLETQEKNETALSNQTVLKQPPTQNETPDFFGKITTGFLKEAISGQNSESEERVNIIFDCRNMNKQEFDNCVNYLWRFFNDEPSNIPNISFGLFQMEPFKSSREKFNVWYIDRNLLDRELAFNNPNQSCDMRDETFTYDSSLHNIILVYVCNSNNFAFSTLFPIREKEIDQTIFSLGPGNVKSVVSMGINEDMMEYMDAEPSALGLSLVLTHEMGHAIGGLDDEYSGNIEDKETSEQSDKLQESDVVGGFPNCATSIQEADLWWKKTGLLQKDQEYVNGCVHDYYIIPYKYTMMSKYFYDTNERVAIFSSDDLFSPIHRYWICRNIYNMTGSSSGVCLDYQNRYGFDRLLYTQNDTDEDIEKPPVEQEIWNNGKSAISGKYADADIVDLGNGKYRMYYSEEPEVQGFEGRVYSATSTDGINWKSEAGTRMTWATFPSVIKLADGKYRMYFQRQQTIKSAISLDGLTWEEETGIRIDSSNNEGLELENVAAPTVISTDSSYLMVYRGTINQRYSTKVPNSNTQLLFWATSDDGLSFEKKGIALDSRNSGFEGLLDGPELVKWDNSRTHLYFWSYNGISHVIFENNSFSQTPEFDYTTASNSMAPFPENPPCDPTFMKINDSWFMYYGQHTEGIDYATLEKVEK